jgi:hypothetical protein
LGEKLNLGRREVPLLCLLMLRGPQTVGELRGRTERMHDFADMEEVESVLQALAARQPEPFVTALPRGRWAQLLGGAPEAANPIEETPSIPHNSLADRVSALESEVAELKQTLESFRKQFE